MTRFRILSSLGLGAVLLLANQEFARADGPSYKVLAFGAAPPDKAGRVPVLNGTLRYAGGNYSSIIFTDQRDGRNNFSVDCSLFQQVQPGGVLRGKESLAVQTLRGTVRFISTEQDLTDGNIRQGLQDECTDPTLKAFAQGVLNAWRASDEQEPFASIRGDYDLQSTDSRQWKTNLRLTYSDHCALIKTAGELAKESPAWTYTCQFHGYTTGAATYENIVQAVQSVLNIQYRPDETAANVNQVYFSDPAKPLWRLVVTKLADPSGNVLLWITPQQLVNGSAATPFNPVAPSSDTSIRAEIEKIRTGKYTSLPRIQRTGATTSRNGMAVFEVKNDTAYALTALFSGPIERRVEVAAGSSVSVELPPGAYKLVGRVNAPDVLPSYGEHTFDQSSSGLRFFLQ